MAVARYQAFSRYPFLTADGLCYVTRGSHREVTDLERMVILADVYPRLLYARPQEHPEGKNGTIKACPTRGFLFNDRNRSTAEGESMSSCTPSFSGCDSYNNETLITRTNSFSRVLFEQLGSMSLEQARGKFSFFTCIFI